MRPNKGMKLTKLSAAWLPAWTCRLMPAPANGMDAGTASQLIPGVRQTNGRGRTSRRRACDVFTVARPPGVVPVRELTCVTEVVRPRRCLVVGAVADCGGILAVQARQSTRPAFASAVVPRVRYSRGSPRTRQRAQPPLECVRICTERCWLSRELAGVFGAISRPLSAQLRAGVGGTITGGKRSWHGGQNGCGQRCLAVEQGDEADEAFGGMVASMDMPPHARAG